MRAVGGLPEFNRTIKECVVRKTERQPWNKEFFKSPSTYIGNQGLTKGS